MLSTMSPSMRSIRRRNALVPLPLLPPVPRNTIVTSVRIVHNQSNSDSPGFDGSLKSNSQPSPPQSPTQASLCFPPLTSGGGTKRPRTTRRRSSCTPCTASPSIGTTGPCDNNDNSLLNPNRKPRSTIVVTVRLANEGPQPQPLMHSSSLGGGGGGTQLAPAPRRAPDRSANVANVSAAAAAMLARKQANKPRISSPLALSVVSASDDPHSPGVSPLSSPTAAFPLYAGSAIHPPVPRPYKRKMRQSGGSKRGASKAKNGGRVGLLRWAVLNDSGPEVGRRILSTGVHLAKEIWDAERMVEEEDSVHESMDVEDVQKVEEVQEQQQPEEVQQEQQREREQLAEECIRELEEMDVDSEDVEMEVSSVVENTESPTETQITKNNNNMEVDVPAALALASAPVAIAPVAPPAARTLQVQVQLEIAVQVFSLAKKAQKELEKPKRWFERIAL